MTTPQLVRDTSGGVVQALNPIATVSISLSAGSTRVALPLNTDLVRIASSVDCYVKLGDSTVTATASDMYFPAGVEVFSMPGPLYTHIAAVLAGATPGILTATQMV